MNALIRVVAALALPVSVTCAAAEAKQWLSLPSGAAYALSVDKSGSASTRVAVQESDASARPTPLDARIFDVSYKDDRSKELASAFSVVIDDATATVGRSMNITVAGKPETKRPGPYLLTLHVLPKKGGGAPQVITLTLQRPAPQIVVGPTVVLGQTRSFLRIGQENLPGKLQLQEQSGNAPVLKFSVAELRDAQPGMPDSGILLPPEKQLSLEAGGVMQASFLTTGEFPLGKSTGKIELRATELAAPLTIPYEVRAREHLAWIVVLAALGAAIGWFVRYWLKNRQALASARAAALAQMETMTETLGEVADQKFQDQVRKSIDRLRKVAEGTKPTDIGNQVTAAVTELASAQAALEQAQLDLRQTLEPLHRVLHQKWELPPSGAEALAAAIKQLDAVEGLTKQRNYSEAKAKVAALIQAELLGVVRVAGKWSEDLGAYLQAAVTAPPAVSPEMNARLKTLADAVSSETGSYSKPAATNLAVAEAMLATAHRLYDSVRQFAAELARESSAFMDWAVEELDASGKPNADLLIAAAKDAADGVAADIDSPDDAADRLKVRYRRLVRAWKSLLQNMFQESALIPVNEALDRGSFAEAVTKARELIASRKGIALDGNAPEVSFGVPARPPAASASVFMAQPPASDGVILTAQQTLAHLSREKQAY